MKEFNFKIREALARGLYRADRPTRNGSELETCTFLRPTPEGLKDHWPVTEPDLDPSADAPVRSWPFPHYHRGESQTFLCEETTIRKITETVGGDWLLAAYKGGITGGGPWHMMDFGTTRMFFNGVAVVYDTPYSSGAQLNESVTIKTGCAFKRGLALFGGFDPTDYWSTAWQNYFNHYEGDLPDDFTDVFDPSVGLGQDWVSWGQIGGGDLLMLFDPDPVLRGSANVIENGHFNNSDGWTLGSSWEITDGLLKSTGVDEDDAVADAGVTPLVVGRTYKYRIVLDGLKRVEANDGALTLTIEMGGATLETIPLEEAAVNETRTGTFVCSDADALMTFSASLWVATTEFVGGFSEVVVTEDGQSPLSFDILDRNEAGAIKMPWRGPVLKIIPMGNDALVYGQDGVSWLRRFSEPFPTFAPHKVIGLPQHVGCAGRGAAGGSLESQIFVDEGGYLWHINSQFQAEKLGYKDFIQPMLGNEIMVNYDEHQDEFWIADGTDSYVLNRNGLGKSPYMPTSVHFVQGGSVGIVDTEDTPFTGKLITVENDLGTREYKHIAGALVKYQGISSARMRVHYRYNEGDEWRQSKWSWVNPNGYCKLTCSAVDFKIELDGTISDLDAHIESIEIRYQKEDKRYVRGTQGIPESA